MSKKFIIGLIFVVAIAGAFSYLLLTEQRRLSDLDAQIQKQSQTPDVTANWKTYLNKERGFSFKYPNNWYLEDDQSSVHLSNYQNASSFNLGNVPNDLESIFINTETIESSLSPDDLKPGSNEIIRLVKFDQFVTDQGFEGRRVVVYTADHPVGYHTFIFFLDEKGKKITFSLGVMSEDIQDIFNQIIFTFKFL